MLYTIISNFQKMHKYEKKITTKITKKIGCITHSIHQMNTIHTYIHTYMHACIHACIHTYISIYSYIHTYVCIFEPM